MPAQQAAPVQQAAPAADRASRHSDASAAAWLAHARLRLAEGVRLTSPRPRAWELTHAGRTVSFVLPGPLLSPLFERLAAGGLSMAEVCAFAEDRSPRPDQRSADQQLADQLLLDPLSPFEQLARLWKPGLLVQTLVGSDANGDVECCIRGDVDCGVDLITLHGTSTTALLPVALDEAEPIVLREDACLRPFAGGLAIETAACGARIDVRDPRLRHAATALIDARSPLEIARQADVPVAWTMGLASWLVTIGAADRCVSGLACGCDAAAAGAASWSFADRLFHARSRMGRHVGGYGGTFPGRDTSPAPSLFRPSRGGARIALDTLDLAAIAAREPSFTTVFEQRRSLREHADEPITREQLGHFLYRTARVKGRVRSEHYELTSRPYPSGGSLYELEIYALINHCADIAPSLYWYDAEAHTLEQVSEPTADTRALSDDAQRSMASGTPPHVLFVVAARFPRVFWKYESMGYALILKNVGVLYEAMYLVAAAMGLAACAIGGGNAETFCRAAGTAFWDESSVGELALGRPRRDGA